MNESGSLLQLLLMLIIDPRTGVLIALLALAAVIDFRSYRIPNWLTVSGMAFGLIYNAAVPMAPDGGLVWSLQGLALGFLIMLPMYLLRVMGAGDVKLMAMAGSILGATGVLQAIICTFIAGGIAAIGYALFRRALRQMLGNIIDLMQQAMFSTMGSMRPNLRMNKQASVGKLPYGVSIAIGTIGWMVATQLGYM